MIAKGLLQTSIFKSICNSSIRMNFADNKWKDRQQSAEKIFINSEEKKTLSKLLNKIEQQEADFEARQTNFERRLRQVVGRHQFPNQAAFIAEVINLHKNL